MSEESTADEEYALDEVATLWISQTYTIKAGGGGFAVTRPTPDIHDRARDSQYFSTLDAALAFIRAHIDGEDQP